MTEAIVRKFALSKEGARGFIFAVAACTVQNISFMIPVSLLYLLINDLLAGSISTSHYWLYGIGIVLSLAIIFAASFWEYDATYFTTYRESGIRRIRIAEKLRKLPLSYFGKKDLSDLTRTIMADCTTIEQMTSHYVPQFYGSIISTALICICLFAFDWRMALAALWVLPVSLAIVAFSKKAQNYFTARQNSAALAVAEGTQECLETIRDLKSSNAEQKYLNGLYKKIDALEGRHIKSELGVAMFVVPAQMILKFGIVTVALVGAALLVADSPLDVLKFFMFLLVVSRLYEPLASALQNLAAMNSLVIPVSRMSDIENYPELQGSDMFAPNGYDVEFSHVAFSYENSCRVLEDVSFTAKQGQVTALIGPSGGGKSTTARLAARFWDVDGGKVTIGGVDVKTVDPEKLLSVFSIVFQDVTLFNNTVMENIRIGRKDASDEEVIAAAREAMCEEFVAKLPEGYNTVIGENGSALSGGERQRISIARALLKDAPIILLDEATASLDAENETAVQRAISRLIEHKTVIIIAHRMRTVESADKIVVIRDGTVAEQGSPKELLERGGVFAKMLSLQRS